MWNQPVVLNKKGPRLSFVAPSVGIIIYQSPLKIHRPVWCWLGWGVEGWRRESKSPPLRLRSGQALAQRTRKDGAPRLDFERRQGKSKGDMVVESHPFDSAQGRL